MYLQAYEHVLIKMKKEVIYTELSPSDIDGRDDE
jgi:hypothetical protein